MKSASSKLEAHYSFGREMKEDSKSIFNFSHRIFTINFNSQLKKWPTACIKRACSSGIKMSEMQKASEVFKSNLNYNKRVALEKFS